MEVEGWEIIQARKKAEREQAEAEQQAAHQERCERAARLYYNGLQVHGLMEYRGSTDVILITFEGHKFEIRELEGE
jgi:hypothetical protein